MALASIVMMGIAGIMHIIHTIEVKDNPKVPRNKELTQFAKHLKRTGEADKKLKVK
jgi:hypothetical protein